MSMLTHRSEQPFRSSERRAPAVSAARRAMVRRFCRRALTVLLMGGLLAGLIAVKTVIFLPRFSY